jgi:hypothetical protein
MGASIAISYRFDKNNPLDTVQVEAYNSGMNTPKSTVEEIRARVDADVERFSRVDILHKNGPFAAFSAVK